MIVSRKSIIIIVVGDDDDEGHLGFLQSEANVGSLLCDLFIFCRVYCVRLCLFVYLQRRHTAFTRVIKSNVLRSFSF